MRLSTFCTVLLLGHLGFVVSLPHNPKGTNSPSVKVNFETSRPALGRSVQHQDDVPSLYTVAVQDAASSTAEPNKSLNIRKKEKLVITVEKTSVGSSQISPGDQQCPDTSDTEGQKCATRGALDTLMSVADELKRYLMLTTGATQQSTPLPPVTTTSAAKVDTQLYRSERTGCDARNCKPPGCACSGELPPGGLAVEDMPQFVMLTFDYAVHEGNLPFFYKLLGGVNKRNKATGCEVGATFFVTADIDYVLANELYQAGSEIALHCISNRDNPDFWRSLSTDQWEREVLDQRQMLKAFGNISEGDVKGFRGPFLNTGGDNGFQALRRNDVNYDNSLVHLRRPGEDRPLYPYTLDYGFKMPCVVEPCPRRPYPGLWVFPVNVFLKSEVVKGQDVEVPCPIGDACEPQPESSNDTFHYLRSHFEKHYNTNRAPFQLSLPEGWMKDHQHQDGYLRFVDWLLQKEDVHLVTMSQVLDFMRSPVPLNSYNQRPCQKYDRPRCPMPTSCSYPSTPLGNFRYMRSCSNCPVNFPWLQNPLGH